MDLQGHSRIAQIRHISTYLHRLLSLILMVFPITYLALIVGFIWALFYLPTAGVGWLDLATIDESCTNDLFNRITTEGATLPLKLFFIGALTLFTICWRFILLSLWKLAGLYSKGDIFNAQAIASAKQATLFASLLIGFEWAASVLMFGTALLNVNEGNGDRFFSLIGSSLHAFAFIGFLYVIVWTLEIGADLNQESELTI